MTDFSLCFYKLPYCRATFQVENVSHPHSCPATPKYRNNSDLPTARSISDRRNCHVFHNQGDYNFLRDSLLAEACRILFGKLAQVPFSEEKMVNWRIWSSNSRPEPVNFSDSSRRSLPRDTDFRNVLWI